MRRLLVVDRTGSFSSYTVLPIADYNSTSEWSAGSDDVIFGNSNATKYVYYAPTHQLYAPGSSWATTGSGGGAGFDEHRNRLFQFTHGNPYAFYEYSFSPTAKTGSTLLNTGTFPAPQIQYVNNNTTFGNGRSFLGSQAGNNSTGGIIMGWNCDTNTFTIYNCSASAGLLRVSSAYDHRRNYIWTCANGQLIAHNADTAKIVTSMSWSLPDTINIECASYVPEHDEVWAVGYLWTRIYCYNLTTNTTRAIDSPLTGLANIFLIAVGGGTMKLC